MTTMMLVGTGLAAIAVVATWMAQQRDTKAAPVAIRRDIFVPPRGDRVISCFEIPRVPFTRDERGT